MCQDYANTTSLYVRDLSICQGPGTNCLEVPTIQESVPHLHFQGLSDFMTRNAFSSFSFHHIATDIHVLAWVGKQALDSLSQPPLPNSGPSGTNSEHDNHITKPIPTHSPRHVSTRKLNSSVVSPGRAIPQFPSLSCRFMALPLFSLILMIYCCFLFPTSSFLCLIIFSRKNLKFMCMGTKIPLRTQDTQWIHLY